jgi:hypothetical protein
MMHEFIKKPKVLYRKLKTYNIDKKYGERNQKTKVVASHPTAFIHSKVARPHKRLWTRLGFDYPATFCGAAEHFNVYFDPNLGTDGEILLASVLAIQEYLADIFLQVSLRD